MSLNQVQLIGRVGQDPEIRNMRDDARAASLSIATAERWKDRSTGEKQERTEWHRVSILNQNLVSLVANYVNKGDMIFVQGKLQTRKWTDSDGTDRYITEVQLGFDGKITLLGGKAKGDTPPSSQHHNTAQNKAAYDAQAPSGPSGSYDDDEIPF